MIALAVLAGLIALDALIEGFDPLPAWGYPIYVVTVIYGRRIIPSLTDTRK